MTLWEISSRSRPYDRVRRLPGFNTVSIVQKIAAEGCLETVPSSTPAVYAQVIKHCWNFSPEKRPSAKQVVDVLQTKTPSSPHLSSTHSFFRSPISEKGKKESSLVEEISSLILQAKAQPLDRERVLIDCGENLTLAKAIAQALFKSGFKHSNDQSKPRKINVFAGSHGADTYNLFISAYEYDKIMGYSAYDQLVSNAFAS